MTAIALTAAKIATPHENKMEVYSLIAAETISTGQAVYTNANGKAALADASAAGTLVDVGIALNTAGAGQAVSVIYRGFVAGYTVGAMAYGAAVYVSDTAGGLDTAAGTVSKQIGRIRSREENGAPVPMLYVDPA